MTGNWGHIGTQNQFAVLIRQIRSKQRRLQYAREKFMNLYLARPIADYGDDSILTTNVVEQSVRAAGQIVYLVQILIEDGDI
jgi:hypothetical protein